MNGKAATPDQLEPRVQAIGRELLDRAQRGAAPGGWAMRKLMADDRLRVSALRFVDVLPALADDDHALLSHVQQYFTDEDVARLLPLVGRFPRVVDWAMRRAREGSVPHLVAPAVRTIADRMARNFIAGRDAHAAMPQLHRLRKRGMGFTIDLLGEATLSEAEAAEYERRYLALIEQLAASTRGWPGSQPLDTVNGRPSPRLNVSVKLSALYSQMRPISPQTSAEAIKHRLRPILRLARECGAFVNLDMEQYDTCGITLRAFRDLLDEPAFRDWPNVGIALQAYLRRTADDVDALAEWARQRGTPVTIRLVRGAYWDYETVIAQQHGWTTPVWTEKQDTDASYERCVWKLFAARPHLEPAIATHNVRSLALGLAWMEHHELDATGCEFQMLYGMADALKDVLVERGQRLRVYVPVGELIPGMAYLVRRLLENTASQSFLRMSFAEHRDPHMLLAPPHRQAEDASVASPAVARADGELPAFSPESVRRFTEHEERDAMHCALGRVSSQQGRSYPLIIGHEPRPTAQWIESINPSNPKEQIGCAASATEADAHIAMTAAEQAFASWRDRSVAHRAALLHRAANVMRGQRDELAAWQVIEAGKPWAEADADVCEAIDFLEYYARQALRLAAGQWMNAPGETNHYGYQPRGPGAVIAPWNFPLAILTGMTSAAIVTGNTVVIKPAPQTPIVAAKLMEIFMNAEVALPPGVVNYLPGDDEAGAALVRDARTHFVAFTGSVAAGTAINAVGAQLQPNQQHVKRIIAEMGGKNAIIIDDDADLDDAVRGVIASAFGYAGQKCSACSRAIVVGDLHDAFVHRLVEAARSLDVGPSQDPASFMGPVIDDEAHQRITAAIGDGATYARLVLDGRAMPRIDGGYFIGPTVFVDVPPESALAMDEIFGPVLAVLRARDFAHALELANGTRYALTGGVYSRSPANLRLARQRFAVGNLYLNRKTTGAVVGRQPFGGFKLSGTGAKAGGPDYLLQFVEPRTVTEDTLRRGFAPDEQIAMRMQRDPGEP